MRRFAPWLIVLVLLSGCGASDGEALVAASPSATSASSAASPTPRTTPRVPQLIRYAKIGDPNDFGVRLRSTADLEKLEGAPESFKSFLRAELAGDAAAVDCPSSPVIDVEAIDTRGLAVGSVNQCGGYLAFWGMDRSGWKEIFQSQAPGQPCPRFRGFTNRDFVRLAGPGVCGATSTPSPVAQHGQFRLGETAHFPYFDVTVHELRSARNGVEGGGMYGARVTVCYTRVHPGARSDGSTRTSADPWRFGWAHGLDPVWLRAEHPTDHWKPVYRERILRVGECNSGWLSEEFRKTTFAAHIGMRYAPGDFAFSGTWLR